MYFRSVCCLCLFCAGTITALGASKLPDPSPEQIQQIIKQFAQKESELAAARELYTYRQSVKLTEVEPAGGTFEVVENVSFDDRDRRTSHVTYAPVNGLQFITMTPEDQQDLENIMPFSVTADALPNYDITYVGHEPVDELTTYVFNVKPKVLTKDRKRYFEGQIWVDDHDIQIVKSYGKSSGYLRRGEDQQFAKFQTYRQLIDNKYWFPVYTYADDVLHFQEASYRIKEVIKYDQYKRYHFKSETSIQYGSEVPNPNGKSQPAPATGNGK
jgi:hypothetical protein